LVDQLLVAGTVRLVPVVLVALLPAGLAWVTVLANVNGICCRRAKARS
jgi:hypothetical protein